CTYTHTHTQKHVHTCTETHVHTHIQTHVYTHRHAHTHVHTRRHMYRYTQCIHTDTCTCIHRHTQTHTHAHTHTYSHAHTPYKKLQHFVVHAQSRVLHSRGRQRAQHTLLPCFLCTQLLSSLTAPSANDRSSLSSEPAQQDGPGGHTCPHHNFHSPLASRRVEISRP
ncbi:unnamed protein product, partial [Staurois parvus]